ncbi:Phenylalanine--tRNA ligase beta subunit [Frankliniella fusca]|uniref:Phenylalanine--tRNA ligase beta subunit n=1 Tax=Frankliniella fusca TaxID=407009 RepID=A0AAE1HA25_9NEOP|nr:Phenylalanine--tRNA ligase beta subunit [Frankliniella fusca]
MDSCQALRVFAVAAWLVFCILGGVLADTDKAKSISDALADADRYAGSYNDAYVANAWERAADGWVRGGYTLVSGDVHTDVRYVVDPSGEMRVMARRPGVAPAAAPGMSSASTTTALHHQLGRQLVGGHRPPFYRRLVRLGSLHDDEHFDDVDLDLDDDPVDDDDPFFFDLVPDNWNAAGPVDEWVRLMQVRV